MSVCHSVFDNLLLVLYGENGVNFGYGSQLPET